MSYAGRNSGTASSKLIDYDKMQAFDALPRPIRLALHDAPFSYAPRDVEDAWKRSGLTAEQYARERMPAAMARDLHRWSTRT